MMTVLSSRTRNPVSTPGGSVPVVPASPETAVSPMPRLPSAGREVGRAAFPHGGRALAEVLGLAEEVLLLALVGHGLTGLAHQVGPHGPAYPPHRQGSGRGDLGGQLGGPRAKL